MGEERRKMHILFLGEFRRYETYGHFFHEINGRVNEFREKVLCVLFVFFYHIVIGVLYSNGQLTGIEVKTIIEQFPNNILFPFCWIVQFY